ncbi:protein ALP1-like isoform X2 [Formica exsecta]|uniref:protein ALP1-like isoform X2 n=1 Tax=Formica exsecta TaxID=72781 RepID=UPI001141C1B3|nr:protein ALP1-like isoform X2 [Formica exsecta]
MRYIRKVLLINKINEWKRTQLNWHKEMRRRQLVKTFLLHQLKKKKTKKKKQSKLWVRSIFTEEKRYYQGDSNNLIREMANDDSAKYFEYLRMTKESFDNLLQLLELRITKKHVIRSPISASMRLQICLRYLASGDTMHSISFAFRVGLNTVSKIVAETCEAIWDVLKDKVFPEVTEALWIQKAKEFEFLWDFPNCIGAIDGKHVQIKAPPKSGSTFYNYKGTHSIVLMAVADANCCFTIVDIGAEGRRSDGDRGPELPYVIIGDEAFALTSYMLRPYARRNNLNIDKKVFNYRLSRARRTVECTFGILTSRWRILRRPTQIAKNVKITFCQSFATRCALILTTIL